MRSSLPIRTSLKPRLREDSRLRPFRCPTPIPLRAWDGQKSWAVRLQTSRLSTTTTCVAPTRRYSQRATHNVNVRNATPADIPELMRIEQSSDSAAHWSAERYQALFDSSAARRLTLVIGDQVIAGFLVVSAVHSDWEIENVIIAESLRRQGLARKLLFELLDRALSEKATSIFLEVRESNLLARRLYESLDFAQV